jgi:hypothetical protein
MLTNHSRLFASLSSSLIQDRVARPKYAKPTWCLTRSGFMCFGIQPKGRSLPEQYEKLHSRSNTSYLSTMASRTLRIGQLTGLFAVGAGIDQ